MERAQGDGDVAVLEQFMRRHVAMTKEALNAAASPPHAPGGSSGMDPPLPRDAGGGGAQDGGAQGVGAQDGGAQAGAAQGAGAQGAALPKFHPLFDDVGELLCRRGGSAGTTSLYAQGTDSATAAPVDAASAGRVAVEFLREMCAAAVREAGRLYS